MTQTNSITGRDNHLLPFLTTEIEHAHGQIDIIVSFLKVSGVSLLIDQLVAAAKRGVKIRILTGIYLNITEPSALYLLKQAFLAIPEDHFELRIYNGTDSFHPKSYLFTNERGGTIYLGSSNLSKSALTSAVEWNYRFYRDEHQADFTAFQTEFETLFAAALPATDALLRQYARQHRLPKMTPTIQLVDGHAKIVPLQPELASETTAPYQLPQPKGAQIEALYELQKTRLEGFDKGLVIAATGIGKTYLAAFDSQAFTKVLFLAHTEDILKQAATTFATVHPDKTQGFYYGVQKDTHVDHLFATVQTMSNYLEVFAPAEFDYVVVDEFHHASAPSYQKIIDYFQPKFLLGLTATPERLDNRDVFALCDYNVVYEIRLAEAIGRNWLAPFDYYGIYDPTDYSAVARSAKQYNVSSLEAAFRQSKRAELIFQHYKQYHGRTTLGFCVSRVHALEMAEYFSQQGIRAFATYSGEENSPYFLPREQAIARLNDQSVDVIFSVNMFNEGIDVPHIELLLFLRPTESVTIFLQQLGRGLRKSPNKQKVIVLDFIGNYRDVEFLPQVLGGNFQPNTLNIETSIRDPKIPEGCTAHFDLQVVDLMTEMAKAKRTREQQRELALETVYLQWQDLMSESKFQHPSRVETYRYLDDAMMAEFLKMKTGPLRNHLRYFADKQELNAAEIALLDTPAEAFLALMETTVMTQLYKLPLLQAFIDGETIKTTITRTEIIASFHKFYSVPSHLIDLTRHKKAKAFCDWQEADYVRTAKNPIGAFLNSAAGFFSGDIDEFKLLIDPEYLTPMFVAHLNDIIAFRREHFLKSRLEKYREQL
ncbi:MAG: DEAD/DEAH box helicase family protein [Culicoidibacterales bacterium]